jgi:4-aminobutyrate aminotransferase-like enzyme
VVPPPGPRSRALSLGLDRHVAPGISTVVGGEPSLVWQEALGANVLDVDGNLFVDLTAGFGVASIGHRRPEVVAAVADQAARLLHALGDVAAHPARLELARRLAELAPVASEGDEVQVFFAVSGAEAVEIALKTALAATGKPAVVAFDPGYHGVSLGALVVTSRPEFRAPFSSHLHAHVERFVFGGPLDALAARLERRDVGAVIFEPIVGREGALLPPPGWLADLADLAQKAGTLLIADEIFTGFGRTGYRFAVEAEGVRPDLLCCGKALGGGLPIAAVLGRSQLFAVWRTPGEALHTATFVAHPLACAAALATLDVLDAERLPERALRLGEALSPRLSSWPERFSVVREIRGRGLLWGVELRTPIAAKRLVAGALARGVLLLAGGPEGTVAQIAPPLTISSSQLALAIDILESVLASISPEEKDL